MIPQTSECELLAPYLEAPGAAPLLELNFGFARARVLDTALQLRLFTHVAQGICTCSTLAALTGCDARSFQRLLDALVGLELLYNEHTAYSLSPLAMTYLVEDKPGYIGGHLMAVMKQWDTWGELTRTIRGESKQFKQDWGSPHGRGCSPGMFTHVFPLTFPMAWRVANQLDQPLQGRVLDVFASSGAWGIAVALCHPQVEVVAWDDPTPLATVREKVQQFGLQKRFTFHQAESDFCSVAPESFNLIIVAHACRFLGACGSQELLKECYRLLQPGGQLLLVDVTTSERAGPPAALIIQLSLFLNTREGDVFTATQFHTWLNAAGFADIKHQRIEHTSLLLASKHPLPERREVKICVESS